MDASTIAAAKYRAGLAAGVVAEHAHQLHGAIGYTGEFGLARLNRRLWQWREDFGGEAFRANELGQGALATPWPLRPQIVRSEKHTSELQSLMGISDAVFWLKKKKIKCI